MYTYKNPHPAVSTDIVLFTIVDGQLKVLLVQRAGDPYRGYWALPGGFVEIDEDLEAAALRELREETGITGVYLEQLYTFGQPDRDPRERVITVAYYALAPAEKLHIQAASDARDAAWFDCNGPMTLAFDHDRIISIARDRLASKCRYSTIAMQFMPARFTLTELQRVYEIIMNVKLDKRNFRKRVQSYNCIEYTGEVRRSGKHRPARLYTLKSPGNVEFVN